MPLRRRQSFSDEFSLLDKDGDGSLSKEELIAALQAKVPDISPSAAHAWANGVMRLYDRDDNGRLDRLEFASFMNQRQELLEAIFDELDASNTGRISAADVKVALDKANVPHVSSDVDRVLKRFGDSKDGVTFDAFFEASVLLPAVSAESMVLLGTASALPVAAPPPGTTPWMIVAAGFVNGAVSRTLTAPTDRLRAVLATGAYPDIVTAARTILRQQGVMGFWSSNLANVVQVAPENGISFALNELLRDRVCADPAHPSMVEKFALGGLAGAVAMSAVYPMYVVQNRQAAARPGQYTGMMDCVREVVRGGAGSMYAGYQTALVRVLPLKGIMLGGYSVLKDACKDSRGDISTTKSLMCSAAAGGAAHALTYPLHLARTVLQQPVPEGGRAFSGFVDVLTHRVQTQGIGGCFRGLPIWLCNRVPAVAIEFAVNERALDAFKRLDAWRGKGGGHGFSM